MQGIIRTGMLTGPVMTCLSPQSHRTNGSRMTEFTPRIEGRLVIYCRQWCGDCMRALRWLDERDVEYDICDVEREPAGRAFAESVNDGRLHTPTFSFGEETCVDFNVPWLCERLGVK